jgi:hypothetical protein
MDSAVKVLAVTADKTDAATTWGTINTAYTIAVAAPIAIQVTGTYYLGVMVATSAGTQPTFQGLQVAAGIAGAAPVLCGSSSTAQTTPPTVGTTMTAMSSAGGYSFYAYTS